MNKRKFWLGFGVLALALTLVLAGGILSAQAEPLTDIEQLGKALFFDEALSINGTQSCATCHAPEVGYVGPDSTVNAAGSVYQGALPNHFGNRKPPSAAYGGESPVMWFDGELWLGGMFWDGRATGWTLGDPLAEQAKGPFLNPLEQALPNARVLCVIVSKSSYAFLFKEVWGADSLVCAKGVGLVYDRIGLSIAAYERSAEVNPFSSKFDYFWGNTKAAGKNVKMINDDNYLDYTGYGLTDEELYGLALFNDEDKGKCALCHTLDEGSAGYPLFTDFSYDNLGVPKNPDNPFYTMPHNVNPDGEGWIDYGLGGFLKAAGYLPAVYEPEFGKHKVPSLRNVDLGTSADFVKAYGHNGYFKSLEEITHFYNTRDVETWPAPEYSVTVNHAELGDLGLSLEEEAAIVLFMTTLSDGHQP